MKIYRHNETLQLYIIEKVSPMHVLGSWYEAKNYYNKQPILSGKKPKQFTQDEINKLFTEVFYV